MLPEIDFFTIRPYRNSQSSAFEELCCQLAGDDQLTEEVVSFNRKGPGADGGIECFAQHLDGTETGWQVKYYRDMASAITSLDESLNKALITHPNMSRFIACFPIDLADSRKPNVTTALSRWESWRTKRIATAALTGRSIEIERWDAFEIKKRLTTSNPASAGRVLYWFHQVLFTHDWFIEKFARSKAGLGPRYSPENHVDLPIRRVLEATALDPRLYEELAAYSNAIKRMLTQTSTAIPDVFSACDVAAHTLNEEASARGKTFEVEKLRDSVQSALEVTFRWHHELRSSNPSGKSTSAEEESSNLLSVLNNIAHNLAKEHWDHVHTRALLVIGDAGKGKSHLLADVCEGAINAGRPAVLILGGKLPDGEPWEEILKDLAMSEPRQPNLFLGALNAAGEAAGTRALLMIDAINERNGRAIWPERLTGLIHDVSQFEWVTLVLSCRSSYESLVVPTDLDHKRLPRITHEGFSEHQARQYLKSRGITLAEEPHSIEELRTPLFLKTCCDALLLEGEEVLTSSLGGVTAVFKLYTGAVAKQVTKHMGFQPRRRLAEQAIDLLADEMALTAREEIPADRAYELIDGLFKAGDADLDLLFQLENEGLLAVEPSQDGEAQDEYRFTFQRMSDHAIASSLLQKSVTNSDPASAFSNDTPLRRVLHDDFSDIAVGLLEALAVQLPEKFGTEALDMPDIARLWFADKAFETSLVTRNPRSFSARTWTLVEAVGGARLRYETIIAGSTDPSVTHNARFLDNELHSSPLPQRDATWSSHIARNSENTKRLIEWVRGADQDLIHRERATLTGIQLCWLLTTSNRNVRDTATKALVTLLASRSELAKELWSHFKQVDDGYVTERLLASILGAALQGGWSREHLVDVVREIHADVLCDVDLPANALSRDHARILVAYADHLGALPEGFAPSHSPQLTNNDWPIEYVTEAEIESYKRTYSGGSRHSDEIVSSTVNDGDFARYQLDYVARCWSMGNRKFEVIPTANELAKKWREGFRAQASEEMLAAYERLATVMSATKDGPYWENRDKIDKAKNAFRTAVGEDLYAQWSAEASEWRQGGMYQSYGGGSDKPAEFNLAWARRWVCKRAHELGWSESLHGDFDSSIHSERNEHTLERIGKKYQWIALYELAAKLADNQLPLPGEDHQDAIMRLRNIDPSLLVDQTADDGWSHLEDPCFWTPEGPDLKQASVDQALEWINGDQDIYDALENVEVVNPSDKTNWLVLNGFQLWRPKAGRVEREAWRRVACLVVREKDLDDLLVLMHGIHFQGSGDIPSASSGGLHSYLGEHPWSQLYSDPSPDEGWLEGWRPHGVQKKGVSVRPTIASYLAESSGYDASIQSNVNLNLPAAWLMEALSMRLSDGKTIKYIDENDTVRFMDPSVSLTGRSAALIDRDAFLSHLAEEQLVAIWAIGGEKNVYGRTATDGFGGRMTYTRLFYSEGNCIVASKRYRTFDEADSAQLKALRDDE